MDHYDPDQAGLAHITTGLSDFSASLSELLGNLNGSVTGLTQSHEELLQRFSVLEGKLGATREDIYSVRVDLNSRVDDIAAVTSETSEIKQTLDRLASDVANLSTKANLSVQQSYTVKNVPGIASTLSPLSGQAVTSDQQQTESTAVTSAAVTAATAGVESIASEAAPFQQPTIGSAKPSTRSARVEPSLTSPLGSPSGKRMFSRDNTDASGGRITSPKANGELSLKVQLGKALNDAVSKYSQSNSRLASPIKKSMGGPLASGAAASSATVGSATLDSSLEERLQRIENSLAAQEHINKISAAIVKSNNDSSQADMDHLQMQLRIFEEELQRSHESNQQLRTMLQEALNRIDQLSAASETTAAAVAAAQEAAAMAKFTGNAQDGSGAINRNNGNRGIMSSGPNSLLASPLMAAHPQEMWRSDGADVAGKSRPVDDELSAKVDRSMQSTVALETTAKKLSRAVDELFVQFESLRDTVEGFKHDEPENPHEALMRQIDQLRDQWGRLFTDIKYGLLRRAMEQGIDEPTTVVEDDSAGKKLEKSLITNVERLVELIRDELLDLDMDDATPNIVFPHLDSVTAAAEELLILNDGMLVAKSGQETTLDDLYCEDGSFDVRRRLLAALEASRPVLEEIDDKVFIRRRLDKMDLGLLKKADYSSIKHIESELKKLISVKLEREDLNRAVEKKASLADLDRLRDMVHRKLESLHDSTGGQSSSAEDQLDGSFNRTNSSNGNNNSNNNRGNNNQEVSDINELAQRFEVLHRHFKDLEVFCDSFVPRTEVEEAMHALFAELRTMKSQSASVAMLKEGLKRKADATELERLVTTLMTAVGDLSGHANEASALHARCLVCDRPVTSLTRLRNPDRIGYEKMDDENLYPEQTERKDGAVGFSSNRRTSIGTGLITLGPGTATATAAIRDKVQITTDLTVLKNTIDLPPLNQDHARNLSHSASSSSSKIASVTSSSYQKRLRHSAGGGMGPKYAQDTR